MVDNRLSREAVTTLFLLGLFQFSASMSGIFLNLYLWRLTHDLFVNGLYNIISFLVASLGYALAGKIAKRKDRLFVYRAGIILFAVFYFSLVFVQEGVVEYYYAFAIFNGLASGFYWLGSLTLNYDVTTDQNRIRYLGLNSVSFHIAGIAGPALAGFTISLFSGLQGYIIVFSMTGLLFILTTLLSFRLTPAKTHHKRYYLQMMCLILKKNHQYAKGLAGYIVVGFHQGIMLFLPNILLFSVITQEDKVGYVWGLLLCLSIITSFLMSKYGRTEMVRMYIIIAAIGYILGALFLTMQISTFTVMLFLALYFIGSPLQMNSYTAYYFQLVGKLPLRGHLRMETFVARETSLSIGRCVSIFILIMLVKELHSPLLPWVLFIASIAQLSFFWLLQQANEKLEV